MTLERIDVRRPEAPELSEPGINLHEGLRSDPVQTPLRIDSRLDESCLPQDPQVLGNRRLGQSKLLLDITHGVLGGCEQPQDRAAARLGNDRK